MMYLSNALIIWANHIGISEEIPNHFRMISFLVI